MRTSVVAFICCLLGIAAGWGCNRQPKSTPSDAAKTEAKLPTTEVVPPMNAAPSSPLRAKLDAFAVAELAADVSALPQSERDTLQLLIEAAKQLDPIFDRQAWQGNPQLEAQLRADTTPVGRDMLEYFRVMRGPWDRQAHFEPFATQQKHPPGAGFYPEDLTAEAFKQWIEAHPQDRAAFESLVTVIRRTPDGLEAVPYSREYAQWLKPAAEKLRAAAKTTNNASLQRFLELRADALLSDDYYASDKAWMDLDSRVELTMGPYEVYEDELLGLKASFEAFVTVSDPAASAKLDKFKKYLPDMEAHLPIPDTAKTKRGAESPIRVVDLVFTAGDARKSVQTIAFNLPNDERIRKEKGAKKVMLRNLIETKFEKIMRPIGQQVMAASFHEHLSSDAFFHEVLFHELSHSLGPAFVQRGSKSVEVGAALGPANSALEEGKADVVGAYNVLFMIDKGELPAAFRKPLLVSYFAGLFRSVRFGVAEAHGKGAAVQLNRYLEDGAATYDAATKQFAIDYDKLEVSIGKLAHDILMIQHRGDAAAAEELLEKLGVVTDPVAQALSRLGDIPVDIRPVYPLAGESSPS